MTETNRSYERIAAQVSDPVELELMGLEALAHPELLELQLLFMAAQALGSTVGRFMEEETIDTDELLLVKS